MSADAADDVAVAQVQFFANGAPIGTDTSSPYSISWPNVAAGPYTLTATVTDTLGLTENAVPVQITVSAGGGGPTAQFLTTDATTQGNWIGVYGSDGYNVINDSVSLPAYAQVTQIRSLHLYVGEHHDRHRARCSAAAARAESLRPGSTTRSSTSR